MWLGRHCLAFEIDGKLSFYSFRLDKQYQSCVLRMNEVESAIKFVSIIVSPHLLLEAIWTLTALITRPWLSPRRPNGHGTMCNSYQYDIFSISSLVGPGDQALYAAASGASGASG